MSRLSRRMKARVAGKTPTRGFGRCSSDWDCPPGKSCLPIGPKSKTHICQERPVAAPTAGGQGQSRIRVSSRPSRSEADTCFKVCCGVHEPAGSDCGSGGKITKPGTWSCMKRCLKLPETKKPNPARLSAQTATRSTCGKDMYECGRWPMPGGAKSVSICCPYIGQSGGYQKGTARPRRLRNGCYHPGKLNHAGRGVVGCRMQNPEPVDECPKQVRCGYDDQGAPICAKSVADCGVLTSGAPKRRKKKPGRLARRARARNPGPNGEAILPPPFCDAADCTTRSCGPCDPDAYAFPGRVRTVLEALDQMRADIDFAVAAASDGERAMRAPGAYPFGDPSLAVLTKPGGPDPGNALPTGGWNLCWGPAAVALPSANQQMIPKGTP